MHNLHVLFLALFALSFWWECILLTITWVAITALVENERSGFAFWAMLVGFGTLLASSTFHPIDYARSHPGIFVLYLMGYFVVGFFWSLFKWTLFIRDNFDRYAVLRAGFMRSKNKETLLPSDAAELRGYISDHTIAYNSRIEVAPKVDNHKNDLLRWATWWPFSMFWFIVNNPVRRIFESAFRLFRGIFQGISDRTFQRAEEELHPSHFNLTQERLSKVKFGGGEISD